MKSPIEFFFSLGDKVTKGNPRRKADFDYYMLWIIFIAFLSVLIGNIYSFIITKELAKLGWGLVIFGILWFQYFSLKGSREARKYLKSIPKENKEEDNKIEGLKDMISGFNDLDKEKDGNK